LNYDNFNISATPHHWGGILFLTSDKPLNGYLDHVRRNIDLLDESIEDVRKAPEGEKPAEKRARLKLLRDMIELQNGRLLDAKAHLLGRDDTGAVREPPNRYSSNPQIMFERDFRNFLEPWKESDLRLSCEDCSVESEDVSSRSFEKQVPLGIGDMMTTVTEDHDLCSRCYTKQSSATV
jgi:hypothetical protein